MTEAVNLFYIREPYKMLMEKIIKVKTTTYFSPLAYIRKQPGTMTHKRPEFYTRGGTGWGITHVNPQNLRWKTKSFLKPLHTESFTSWRESPIKQAPDVLKSPLWQHLLGDLGNSAAFTFSYLEVSSIVVVEGLEKRIWLGDVCDQLEFLLPKPESKYITKDFRNREWKIIFRI